jgi:hypothetical protein
VRGGERSHYELRFRDAIRIEDENGEIQRSIPRPVGIAGSHPVLPAISSSRDEQSPFDSRALVDPPRIRPWQSAPSGVRYSTIGNVIDEGCSASR